MVPAASYTLSTPTRSNEGAKEEERPAKNFRRVCAVRNVISSGSASISVVDGDELRTCDGERALESASRYAGCGNTMPWSAAYWVPIHVVPAGSSSNVMTTGVAYAARARAPNAN